MRVQKTYLELSELIFSCFLEHFFLEVIFFDLKQHVWCWCFGSNFVVG